MSVNSNLDDLIIPTPRK